MSKNLVNISILGISFIFLYISFNTLSNIQQTIVDGIKKENPEFSTSGYTFLAIMYITFAVGNWIAPAIVTVTGPRIAMVASSLVYILVDLVFLYPNALVIYIISCIFGIGCGVLWTAHGNYFARCSDDETVSRNAGIFWALYESSSLFGNIFIFYVFKDNKEIQTRTRNIAIIGLAIAAAIGTILLCFLRHVEDNSEMTERKKSALATGWDASKAALGLLKDQDMLTLLLAFFYSGVELAFYSGVYGPTVGFTLKLAETTKELVGFAGIGSAIGEITGCSMCGAIGHFHVSFGRNPLVILGLVTHLVTFILIYLNIPYNATIADTNDVAYFDPPILWLAMLCSVLLGFADACINTQLYSLVGVLFARNSVGAFALFNFLQAVGAFIGFIYSDKISLTIQLIILTVTCILGNVCFICVERKQRQKRKNDIK